MAVTGLPRLLPFLALVGVVLLSMGVDAKSSCVRNPSDITTLSIDQFGLVTCSPGLTYKLSGSSHATCNPTTGFWVHNICQPCTIPVGTNIVNISRSGVVTCAPGHSNAGNGRRAVCLPHQAEYYVRYLNCKPCTIPVGKNIASINTSGAVTCAAGYTTGTGASTAVCQNGQTQWILGQVRCRACTIPTWRGIVNVSKSGDVTCARGYRPEPAGTRAVCENGHVEWNPRQLKCKEVDECAQGLHNCGSLTRCFNTPGSFVCPCQPGHTRIANATDCKPCTIPPVNRFTTITQDGVVTCAPGYKIAVEGATPRCVEGHPEWIVDARAQCTDVNECSEAKFACLVGGLCSNTNGSYTCFCEKGFKGNGSHCLESCAHVNANCSPAKRCVDHANGYRCVCRTPGRTGKDCRKPARNYSPGCQPGEYIRLYLGANWIATTTGQFNEAVRNCARDQALMVDSYNDRCVHDFLSLIDNVLPAMKFATAPLAGVYMYYPNRPNKDYYRWMDRYGNTRGSAKYDAGIQHGRTVCMRFARFQLGCPNKKYLAFPPGQNFTSFDTAGNNKCQTAGMTEPDDSTLRCVQNFVDRVKLTHPEFAKHPLAGPLVNFVFGSYRVVGDDGNTRGVTSFSTSDATRFRVLCVGTIV